MRWTVTPYHNRWLRPGHGRVSVVLNVRAESGDFAESGVDHCVGFILDKSGSMGEPFAGSTRMEVAKRAVMQAIQSLRPGTTFFVLAYDARAQVLIPPQVYESLETVTGTKRLASLAPAFNTRFSAPMREAYRIFAEHPNHVCSALFLTDGRNGEDDGQAVQELLSSKGDAVPFSARGIGDEWNPADLLRIAEVTLGDARALPSNADEVASDFRAIVRAAAQRSTRNVRLCLGLPRTVRVASIMQTSPSNIDLTRRLSLGQGGVEVPLGTWGAEERDYLVEFEMSPLPVGEQMMACRPSISVSDKPVHRAAPVVVEWTADGSLHARIDGTVAHYRGEAEKSREIEEGLKAMAAGDDEAATRRLGRAARIAAESGDAETLERLAKVVDIIDPAAGTVRLRRGEAVRAAVMDLEVSSTRTVRARRSETPQEGQAA